MEPVNKPFGLGVTTAREMVRLLELLEQGEIVEKESSAAMIALMKRRQDQRGLGRTLHGLPSRRKPAHWIDSEAMLALFTRNEAGSRLLAITCRKRSGQRKIPVTSCFPSFDAVPRGVGKVTQEAARSLTLINNL